MLSYPRFYESAGSYFCCCACPSLTLCGSLRVSMHVRVSISNLGTAKHYGATRYFFAASRDCIPVLETTGHGENVALESHTQDLLLVLVPRSRHETL